MASVRLMLAFGILPLSIAVAADSISIVATLPVLKDLTESIGGRHVRVSSLISGLESEHTYTPKPSDILSIQNADLLVTIGLGLETWVAPLIENADRPDLPMLVTSKGVPLVESVAGAHEDHHSQGNPHIWLDPENVKTMIGHISEGLIKADPSHEEEYKENAAAYIQKLSALQTNLQEKVKPLRTRDIITHHSAWPYFARRFGFVIKGTLLTQVGSEPSPKQIGTLIQLIRREGIQVVVSEPQLNQKIPQILAEETGVKIVSLSPLPGAIPGTERYVDLIRYNVDTLVSALEKP
ncbi:MAG: metal ABC transporter substrate-binding protein [Nitrospiria bacterium]